MSLLLTWLTHKHNTSWRCCLSPPPSCILLSAGAGTRHIHITEGWKQNKAPESCCCFTIYTSTKRSPAYGSVLLLHCERKNLWLWQTLRAWMSKSHVWLTTRPREWMKQHVVKFTFYDMLTLVIGSTLFSPRVFTKIYIKKNNWVKEIVLEVLFSLAVMSRRTNWHELFHAAMYTLWYEAI